MTSVFFFKISNLILIYLILFRTLRLSFKKTQIKHYLQTTSIVYWILLKVICAISIGFSAKNHCRLSLCVFNVWNHVHFSMFKTMNMYFGCFKQGSSLVQLKKGKQNKKNTKKIINNNDLWFKHTFARGKVFKSKITGVCLQK